MAELVLVEGSIHPSVVLGRGQRRWMPWTRRVRTLVEHGYVTVLANVTVPLGN